MSTLQDLTVAAFDTKEVVTIDVSDSLEVAFGKLFNNDILSAPVIDANGEVIGQLGVIDVAIFAVHLAKTGLELFRALGLPSEQEPSVSFDDIPAVIFDAETGKGDDSFFDHQPADFIKNFSMRNPTNVVNPSTNLADLVKSFSTYKRALVKDGEKVINYITQTDVLKVVVKNNLLGPSKDKTIAELGIGSGNVISQKNAGPVINAFKQFVLHAVPVVDDENKIVGNISAYDIKIIKASTDAIDTIFCDWEAYKGARKSARKPVTLTSDATFETVVQTVLTNHIHRVYVVDGDGVLQKVISMTDILKALDA